MVGACLPSNEKQRGGDLHGWGSRKDVEEVGKEEIIITIYFIIKIYFQLTNKC